LIFFYCSATLSLEERLERCRLDQYGSNSHIYIRLCEGGLWRRGKMRLPLSSFASSSAFHPRSRILTQHTHTAAHKVRWDCGCLGSTFSETPSSSSISYRCDILHISCEVQQQDRPVAGAQGVYLVMRHPRSLRWRQTKGQPRPERSRTRPPLQRVELQSTQIRNLLS
jgi:hypothetical protein